ncbi:MAG: crotonase/enoyl-CoA hydratase family protein [Novosphingobium sp.]
MEPFLLSERHGAVVLATLNRPDERNAISETAHSQEIADFCASVTRDASVRAVVLTGKGKAFCAGGNVKHMREQGGMFAGSPFSIRNRYRTGIQMIPTALYELEVPVVAAVNGPAIGAGLDLACMCDLRVAADSAVFAESFVKLGIVPGDGGAWLLPRVIGMPRASLMTLTGDTIDAATALEYGLVNEVVPADQCVPRAMELAGRIAANPGHATRMAKRLLRDGQDMKLAPLLEMSAAFQALAHHAEDHHEAVEAFLDKRAPNFRDK